MKLKIVFYSKKEQTIPINYIYQLQSALLGVLPAKLGKTIHEKGIVSKISHKTFRPYNTSRLIFKNKRIKNGKITFRGDVYLYISSHSEDLLRVFAEQLLFHGSIKVLNVTLEHKETRILSSGVMAQKGKVECEAKTLSPIIVMDSVTDERTHKKKSIFYSPYTREFKEKAEQNAREKYSAISTIPTEEIEGLELDIYPIEIRKEVVKYKDMFLTGYSGDFALVGDKELVETVYDLGVGNRSAYSGSVILS